MTTNTTFEVPKELAIGAFKKANSDGKALLISIFGEKALTVKITDRVKTFEDAVEILQGKFAPKMNVNVDYVPSVLGEMIVDKVSAYVQLLIIAYVLNEGWIPDYANASEPKYYPYPKFVPGSGFSYVDFDYDCSFTHVGARLVFKTRELAEYAGKQFEEIYRRYYSY